MQALSIGVVLLNYNSKSFLVEFLPTLLKHSKAATIYMIDNASTDDSLAYVKQHFPTIQLIKLTKNYGFAGGYYHGLKQINEDIFVLLNTDVEVTPNWIEPIQYLFEQDNTLGACQPKILAYHNKNQFEYAGASGGFIDYLGYPFARGRIFDTIEDDYGQYNHAIQCFWASGCTMFLRKDAYFKAGELDHRLFAHQEEIDLCWRIQQIGYKIMAEPKSVVYHVGGGTLNYQSPRKTYLNFRNNMYICIKNWSLSALLWKHPIRVILNIVAALKELSVGNLEDSRAIIKATVEANIHFFTYRFGGFRVKQSTRIKTIYRHSILKQYFYNKYKYYNQLK